MREYNLNTYFSRLIIFFFCFLCTPGHRSVGAERRAAAVASDNARAHAEWAGTPSKRGLGTPFPVNLEETGVRDVDSTAICKPNHCKTKPFVLAKIRLPQRS
jgi:hypothetical protein